ncbi:Rho GTPase activation protein [Basidiobolus meristosporus CBS 931.73]|uniref:Rho GTPase activation protein n=1 Tax=Basidiobolus meristosporus CBS 931.73 TaxID=1314790 RepID=A0A1Y1YFV5_9FUNG|nr:Rho GTPase activation protein [Basidiobolus meristosporus CBS 931.73]|eukprot:ORX96869.1 Rho GTPase activation protein [Basidiobolus meristosporus CBS 931.73]
MSTAPATADYSKQIGDLLMADDFKLLVAICQTTISGDSAAQFAKSIVVWLKQEDSSWLEYFLKRILKQKMTENYAKGLDASDTLRENCMTTKLINSFLWYEGQDYLVESLHRTILSIHSFALNCEIDGFRLGRDCSSQQIEEHKDYLEKACVMLLASMVGNQHKMPASFRRLCHFMKTEIENTWGPMAAKPRVDPDEPRSNRASFTMGNYWKRLSSEIATSISKTNGYMMKGDEAEQKRPLSEIYYYSAGKDLKSNRSSGSWKQDTLMSASEKAVGSLLFLRFFIPAIISPEHYRLVDGCVTPEERRGFLLCAKVLTGMCNNVDFGKKEAYIRIMNPFIHEYRAMIRSFVKFASASSLGSNRRRPNMEEFQATLHSGLSKTGVSDDLISFLDSNLGKIEKDLQGATQLFSVTESEGIMNNFGSLKALVSERMRERQCQQAAKQPAPQPSSVYRFIRRFGFFQSKPKVEELSKENHPEPCITPNLTSSINQQQYMNWT